MNRIQTPSFELAITAEGDENADNLALLIPGRLETKDYANFVSHSKFLAHRGFQVVAFDPPGTWESSGNIDLYTTTNYLKAIDELITYFGNKATILIGHSRGGKVAMLAAANPQVKGIAFVMAQFGASTPPNAEARKRGGRISYRDQPPGDSITDIKKEFQLPMSYWDDNAKYNPTESLRQCLKPKLLIYGAHDEYVTPEEAKTIYNSIPDPKMIKGIESSHDYRYNQKAIADVNNALGEFIEKFGLI